MRITDFGLAGLSAEVQGENARAGTPAYMSPEQFSGGEVTPKSDLYSLGLVMYETFTGKRPYEAATFEEMARLREKSAPTAPSMHLKDIDPLVERVMLRCLEKNPSKRPASAIQVAAALPGGDPLAAALAAGETPSPEMVAAAGEKEGLRPVIAWVCLVLIVVGLGAAAVVSQKTELVNLVPMPNPPDVMAVKARDLAREFGYTAVPVDTAYAFESFPEYVDYIKKNDRGLTRWNNLSSGVPPAIAFWYRESPQFMFNNKFALASIVETDEPPNSISGMYQILLDPQGHLLKFEAVPPQRDTSTAAASLPNWEALFSAAGLDANRFKSVPPQWTPLVTSDARTAWEGTWSGHPDLPLRVEAAAYRGKPVYFDLIFAWTIPDRMEEEQTSTGSSIGQGIADTVIFLVPVLGIFMARSNIRSGRGDRRGAVRLALLVFLSTLLSGLLRSHHIPTGSEFIIFFMVTGWGLIVGAISWILYAALEPHVRKRWPTSLISWSRLLAGQTQDPVVGRDLLVGILTGAFWFASDGAKDLIYVWIRKTPMEPKYNLTYATLSGVHMVIGIILARIVVFVAVSLLFFFVFFLIRLLLRKEWLAALAMTLLFSSAALFGEQPVLNGILVVVFCGIALVVLIRFGLLALMLGLCTFSVLSELPLTTHLSVWYSELSFVVFFVILAAAIFGFYTSTAGKPRFGGISLDS